MVMARLDKEKQTRMEPKRMQFAKDSLAKLGIEITKETTTALHFEWKGEKVMWFPYSGWHTGKSIVDGRGAMNLLNQLKET